jgi:PncC family amidohydrolase
VSDLAPLAERIAAALKRRNETVAVAESSAGGLISAALLGVPGASSYFLGGGVVYTRQSREALLGITDRDLEHITPSTEAYALLLARRVRECVSASWGLAETGTAGPTGSRYGYDAGHTCVAIFGPIERSLTLETRSADRALNMQAFARAALELFAKALDD